LYNFIKLFDTVEAVFSKKNKTSYSSVCIQKRVYCHEFVLLVLIWI